MTEFRGSVAEAGIGELVFYYPPYGEASGITAEGLLGLLGAQ
jgi:hypothetical protein